MQDVVEQNKIGSAVLMRSAIVVRGHLDCMGAHHRSLIDDVTFNLIRKVMGTTGVGDSIKLELIGAWACHWTAQLHKVALHLGPSKCDGTPHLSPDRLPIGILLD